MGRIAVAVSAPDLDAEAGARFGRAAWLLLVDPVTMAWEAVDNPGLQAGGGAGMRAARALRGHQVDSVVAGEFGPNAREALRAGGITVHLSSGGETAREAADRVSRGGASRAVSRRDGTPGAS